MASLMNNGHLAGKVALVTGASRGVGQRIALRLARDGAALALVARGQAGLQATAEAIRAEGGRAEIFPTDLSQATPESVVALRTAVAAALGQPDVIVCAAGIFGPISLIKDVDPAEWLETIRVNTLTPFLICQAFVGAMITAGWGRIINVTSAAALHQPGPASSAYATSKVALNHFTRHLAAELEGSGVTANVIHPGDIKTEMWADIRDKVQHLGPEAEAYRTWVKWVEDTGGDDPEKAADLVSSLTSEAAAHINGQFLWITDGLQPPVTSWGAPADQQPWRKHRPE